MVCNTKSPYSATPCLKGRAKEVHGVVHPLLAVVQRWRRDGQTVDGHIALALKALCEVYELLERHGGRRPIFLADDVSGPLCHRIDVLLQHLVWLQKEAGEQGWVQFGTLVEKHHELWHLGDFSKSMNPAVLACYVNEDLQQYVRPICNSCRFAVAPPYRALAIMRKYLLARHLRMRRQRK